MAISLYCQSATKRSFWARLARGVFIIVISTIVILWLGVNRLKTWIQTTQDSAAELAKSLMCSVSTCTDVTVTLSAMITSYSILSFRSLSVYRGRNFNTGNMLVVSYPKVSFVIMMLPTILT